MNKLSTERKTQVIKVLLQGNPISTTARITDTAINTVVNLVKDVGSACLDYQDNLMRNLSCHKLQCDEIWSFAYARVKNLPRQTNGEFSSGDVWTYTALDMETKLVPCWKVGVRDAVFAYEFVADLKERLAHGAQLTIDGHKIHLEATERAPAREIDYARLVRLYETEPENGERPDSAKCVGVEKPVVPTDSTVIPTPSLEHQNRTMRMSMRRFRRLTPTFSKKLENHMYALALHFMHYNFARSHKSLTKPFLTTPAMEAGVTDHFWSIGEIVTLA